MSSGDGGFNRLRKHCSKRPRTQARSSLAKHTRPTRRPIPFPGLTANPQHALGPSYSVRLLAAPRSAGPVVSCQTVVHTWSLLECAAPGRSSQCGTAVYWACTSTSSANGRRKTASLAPTIVVFRLVGHCRHHRHALLVFIANGPAPSLHHQWN